MPGPVINTGTFFSVYFDSIFDGQQVLFTTHYKVRSVSGAAPDLTAFYQAVNDMWAGLGSIDQAYADCFTTAMVNIKRRIQVIWPNRYSADIRDSNSPTGTRAAAAVLPPANMAACFVMRSFGTAPQSKGTKHVLVSDVGDLAGGFVQGSISIPLGQLAAQLVIDLPLADPAAGVTISPVIYHRAAPAASEFIEAYSILPTARVMRRRSVGQGT
jgi:hypothetical protein